jgi:transposase InsO family protein
MRAYYKDTGLGFLCGLVGKTRQAYYEYTWRKEEAQFSAGIVVDLVKRERRVAKRVGAKRLYLILKSELLGHGITMGRDKFLDVLRANDLLVKRRRRRVQTTMSRHRLRKYPNIAKDLAIDRAEQLWVSDITYLSVEGHHCYLILITDAYSRKVVGHNFGRNMDTVFCLVALQKALSSRCFPTRSLMHHSDRGLQYCSKDYVQMLNKHDIQISMTENGDPLENPLAERMNGIFKDNFGLDDDFVSFEQAATQIDKAIAYYNGRLPHSSIDMLTPNEAHYRNGHLKKHWKWYWKERQESQPKG